MTSEQNNVGGKAAPVGDASVSGGVADFSKAGADPALPHPLDVTFEQRSGKRWTARFELGDETENASAALEVAWKHNASIVGVSP